MLKQLQKLLIASEHSSLKRKLLNAILLYTIPFNRPHRITVSSVSPLKVQARIPYRSSNLNHIKGIHACGLATVSEFCSGLLILRHIDPAHFRLIMQSFSTEFLYQAKEDISAVCEVSDNQLQELIVKPMAEGSAFLVTLKVQCYDTSKNLCANTSVTWQLKPWEKVRTKS